MVKIFGELYYIDFEQLEEFLNLDNNNDGNDGKLITTEFVTQRDEKHQVISSIETVQEHIKSKEINGVKFELIRNFISDIGDEEDEGDEMLGQQQLPKTSIRFKLAYNTLLINGILKKMN